MFRAILLGIRLKVSLVGLKKLSYFPDKSVRFSKLKNGYAGLLGFVQAVKSRVTFSTSFEQQKEILFCFVWLSRLIDNAFDERRITQETFPKVMAGNRNIGNGDISELEHSVSNIKRLTSGNTNVNNFISGILKTWETHKVRDVNQVGDKKISFDDVLKATEDRGRSYFPASIYVLNPANLDSKSEEAIRISGMWFQLLDDYLDRKEDICEKNTLFTFSKNQSPRKLLGEHTERYRGKLRDIIGNSDPLFRFLEDFTALVRVFGLLGSVKNIFEWK